MAQAARDVEGLPLLDTQLLAVLVPVLWVLVKTLALIVLIGLAVFLLAALLLDRK